MGTRLGAITAGLVLTAGLAGVRADMGTLITKDGRRLSGEITVDGNQVRISRNGIIMVLGKDEVEEIQTPADIAKDYKRLLGGLKRGDVAGHMKLAGWCRARGQLELAIERCEHVLEISPNHSRAKFLLRALERKRDGVTTSVKRSRKTADKTEKTAGRDTKAAAGKARAGLLTKQQINRIRIAEFRPGEEVRVRFKKGVRKEYLEEIAGTQFSPGGYEEDFPRMADSEKLADIVEATDMLFADQIEVRTDPEAIRIFKSDIMPVIRSHCATLQCHGAADAKKLRLYTQKNTASLYTNFYLLDSYEKSIEGRDSVRMFDRDYPREGLFLHYLLPKKLANSSLAHAHEKEGAVKDRDVPVYEAAEEWIGDILRRPRVDAGIGPSPKKKDVKAPDAKRAPETRPKEK